MKRVLFVMLMAAVLVFSACGKKDAAANSASGGGEKVTLDLMHFHTLETIANSSEAKGYHAMKDKFIKEHPEVTINETIFQQVDYHTKIMALAAAGEMPDVYFTKGSWVQNFTIII